MTTPAGSYKVSLQEGQYQGCGYQKLFIILTQEAKLYCRWCCSTEESFAATASSSGNMASKKVIAVFGATGRKVFSSVCPLCYSSCLTVFILRAWEYGLKKVLCRELRNILSAWVVDAVWDKVIWLFFSEIISVGQELYLSIREWIMWVDSVGFPKFWKDCSLSMRSCTFYPKGRFIERQGETEEGFPLLVHSLMTATAQAEPVQAQEPGASSGSLLGYWGMVCGFPSHFSSELDQTWENLLPTFL